ncbi:MAG: glycoside hydrolase family 32 protein [Anaerolineales bacterium]|nr:glycoside hydrolase family 32 protein [Anaerolineales bacterium]
MTKSRRRLNPVNEPHRPSFHFSPTTGWMNDPNGLVYHKGEYHLFYQYNPENSTWGSAHWGHAVSRDLVNWKRLPIALYPDKHGMIFSGSAVVDKNNTAGFGANALVIIFTYNKDDIETQNLAYSTDNGRTWTKYAGNPVLPHRAPLQDFRDPRVFWHKSHWVMLVAAGDTILFYTSPNLKNWEQSGEFGKCGSTEGVWETPEMFGLAIGNETRWVLMVSVKNGGLAGGSATQYFIGNFDGQVFTSAYSKDTVLWVNSGMDDYAAQSWNRQSDGRRILIGWQNNWRYANLIPTGLWRGTMSLPRELSLRETKQGIRLVQQPITKLKSLRRKEYRWEDKVVTPGSNLFEKFEADVYEIVAEFQPNSADDVFGFKIRKGETESLTIGCSVKAGKIFVDRSNSGQSDFCDGFADIHFVDFDFRIGDDFDLHIYVDQSSVEVFANRGLIFFSDLFFPSAESKGVELFTLKNDITLRKLDFYLLTSAKFRRSNKHGQTKNIRRYRRWRNKIHLRGRNGT